MLSTESSTPVGDGREGDRGVSAAGLVGQQGYVVWYGVLVRVQWISWAGGGCGWCSMGWLRGTGSRD